MARRVGKIRPEKGRMYNRRDERPRKKEEVNYDPTGLRQKR